MCFNNVISKAAGILTTKVSILTINQEKTDTNEPTLAARFMVRDDLLHY
jgi:hypothetical protein